MHSTTAMLDRDAGAHKARGHSILHRMGDSDLLSDVLDQIDATVDELKFGVVEPQHSRWS